MTCSAVIYIVPPMLRITASDCSRKHYVGFALVLRPVPKQPHYEMLHQSTLKVGFRHCVKGSLNPFEKQLFTECEGGGKCTVQ